ncbi:type VII secretion system-associated protein [Actinoplanes sp. NPDC051859]|uniref:type VII secretion system-associated protein n=1 Tax=Actinoplanes sp. NPDC051859 TaxID=3363909 RepID=UPI0037BCDC58
MRLDERSFLLTDPDWQPLTEGELPPAGAVLGAWTIGGDGAVAPFRSNPDYRPRDARSAADPLDAALRLLSKDRAEPEQVQTLLHEASFEVAVDEHGQPLVVAAPDGVRCVVVATGVAQRAAAGPDRWREDDLMGLVTALPDAIDVLFNPGGPVPVRLTGDFLRETLLWSDDDIAAAYGRFHPATPGPVAVLPWVVSAASQ